MKLRKLTKEERQVIEEKGTERPFSGEYYKHFDPGLYLCKRCDTPLYRSSDKFDSECGWPSFDDELPGAIKRLPDKDGERTEIQCLSCGAHLGHIFIGEKATPKNIRHCVNSISLVFIPKDKIGAKSIVLGGGCFWCIEATFLIVPGVLSVTSGYAGGSLENPTYKQVCTGETGHAEVVRIEYFPNLVTLEKLLDIFLMLHDPTSLNRQGSDVGTQYRSIILYSSENQKEIIQNFLKNRAASYPKSIVTEVKKLNKFYPAEDYHKDYYRKNQSANYCRYTIAPKLKKLKEKLRVEE